MTCDTITIELNGEVAIDDFALAMHHFNGLLRELVKEEGDNADIVWEIEKLAEGSALMSIRGVNAAPKPIENVVLANHTIWDCAANQREIPYGKRIRKRVSLLTKVIGKRVTSIRVETSHGVSFVTGRIEEVDTSSCIFSHGTVKGMVETTTTRRSHRFILYDSLFDKAVTCYFTGDQQDKVREAWGKKVIMAGYVGRDPTTGHAKVIRNIHDIQILHPIEPDNYLKACGIIPWQPGDEEPEDAVRRIRDSWRG